MKSVSLNQVTTVAKRAAKVAEEGTIEAMSKLRGARTDSMEFRNALTDNINRFGLSDNEKDMARAATAFDCFA